MNISFRIVLVIVFTNLVIISFGVLTGIVNVRSDIARSQETDLILISNIADHFIGSEIEALKLKVFGIAQILSASEDTKKWPEVFANLGDHHDFIGMAVLSPDGEIIVSEGELPAPPEMVDDPHIKKAFLGQRTISSTRPSAEHGVVFYLAAPMRTTEKRILVMTLPGMYFSQQLSQFSIWETGHIFICDSEGYAVATPRESWESWIQERFNVVVEAKTDKSFTDLAEMIEQMKLGQSGIGYFSVHGIPRVCSFRPISISAEGWSLGVVAALSESPFRAIGRGLIVVGLVNFFLSIIVAVVASHFIKKPFGEIAALKEIAEMNSKYKSDFIANMSHEIRTPMNIIMGITEIIMLNENLDEELREELDKIYNSGDMLLNIINDILDLSKIEAGKMELMLGKYDLASLINDTVVLNMMRFGNKPIEFKLLVDENLPSTLIGDELRLKQILNNLLSNAFKYTEQGEVKLSFSVGEKMHGHEDDLTLEISVCDTGHGMTEKQIVMLFDEYARFNFSTNRTIEGTGLGMSITQNLLRLMGGDISVKSELLKGSVFTVQIPQERAGSDVLGGELVEKLQNFTLGGVQLQKKTRILYEPMPYGNVLIVDDLESNLYVTKGLMLPYRLTIDTVISGFQAIDKIKNGHLYDIVFMDHMMPKMDGVEATKRMRALGYKRPIVALTANAVAGQMDMFLANGFDDFISKPIDVRHLNTVLKKFVRDKQPVAVIEAARLQGKYTAEEIVSPSVTPQLAEFFVRDVQKATTVLETMIEKRGVYSDEDIRVFTTSVHAMKNALTNVGESELAAFAYKLEQAGWKKEAGVLSASAPAFLGKLRKIVTKFAQQEAKEEDSKVINGDFGYLREQLLVVKKACAVYDKKTAKDAIIELRQRVWSPAVKELLSIMAAHLLSGDFNDVLYVSDMIHGIINKYEEKK